MISLSIRTRQSLKALLSTSLPGTEIWEAANGAEALRLAEDMHPQLVLMDIRMPEIVRGGIAA